MTILLRVTTVFFLLIYSNPTLAGPGHSHGQGGHSHAKKEIVPKSKIESVAKSRKLRLISKGKIPASWKEMGIESSTKKEFSGKIEWVVVFKNSNETNKDKDTLYVFISLYGEFIAANFTGK